MEKQPTDHVFSVATERLLLASNKQTDYNNNTRIIPTKNIVGYSRCKT